MNALARSRADPIREMHARSYMMMLAGVCKAGRDPETPVPTTSLFRVQRARAAS